LKAFDAYNCKEVVANIAAFKKDGYEAVGLYYFHQSDLKQLLTSAVARTITKAGLSIWSIWEDGQPNHVGYFTAAQGALDGKRAVSCAILACQPKGSAIYATYDYDAEKSDLPRILEYATAYHNAVKAAGYVAGAYGNGLLIAYLFAAGLVSFTWLSCSTGYAGHDTWLSHADIVQSVSPKLHGVDVDTDVIGVSGGGVWKVG
jgi:hypothetical protein